MRYCFSCFYSPWYMGDCVSLTPTHPDIWEVVCSLIFTDPDKWYISSLCFYSPQHIGYCVPPALLTLTYRRLCAPCFYLPWHMGGCMLPRFYSLWYMGYCVLLLLFTLTYGRLCVPHFYSPWYMEGCGPLVSTHPDMWEVSCSTFLGLHVVHTSAPVPLPVCILYDSYIQALN